MRRCARSAREWRSCVRGSITSISYELPLWAGARCRVMVHPRAAQPRRAPRPAAASADPTPVRGPTGGPRKANAHCSSRTHGRASPSKRLLTAVRHNPETHPTLGVKHLALQRQPARRCHKASGHGTFSDHTESHADRAMGPVGQSGSSTLDELHPEALRQHRPRAFSGDRRSSSVPLRLPRSPHKKNAHRQV